MNRRDLLKYLLSTPAAALVDYEKLLWVPEKKIFVPSQKQIDFLMDDRKRILFHGSPVHSDVNFSSIWLGYLRNDQFTGDPDIKYVWFDEPLQEDKK